MCTYIHPVCLSDLVLWSETCDDADKDHDIEITDVTVWTQSGVK